MKKRAKALLSVLGLSVLIINASQINAFAADQVKVNLDLDGGTLKSDYDLQLIHKETVGDVDGGGSWIEYADYFSVGQVRELGEPEKEEYTFLGWHGSSEVYSDQSEYTPIEISYPDFYEGWNEEEIAYSPRLIDENNNEIDEITLSAIYVPDLVIDAGDETVEIKADREKSDTSKYVYFISEEDIPEHDDMTGILEIVSTDPERNETQTEVGNYIEVLPSETVKVFYEQKDTEQTAPVETTDSADSTDSTDEIYSETTDEETSATLVGKFTEVEKKIIIAVVVFLGLFILPLLAAYIICKLFSKVEVQNNKSTSEYEENTFVTVQKGNLEVEGNIGIYLTKLIDKNNTEVWKYTITDETLNNRVSDEFKLVLTKSFVKRFNGQQLIVKIGEGENAKTQGFTIDEQETEIKITVDLQD